MRIRAIELTTAFALTIAALMAFAKGADAGDIMVMNAMAAKSLTPAATTGAAYVVLMNQGASPDTLTAISSPAAQSAMLHVSRNVNDVMTMQLVEDLVIGPGGTIDFATTGYHIMFVGLKAPLKPGDKVPLELTFAKAGKISVEAVVGEVPGMSHDKTAR